MFMQGVDYIMLRLYIQNLMEIVCEKKEYEENDKWYTDLFEVRNALRRTLSYDRLLFSWI